MSIRGTWEEIFLGNMKLVSRAVDSLGTLTTIPFRIQDDTMHCTERFVALFYGLSVHVQKLMRSEKLFAKRNSDERIQLSYDALELQYI